MPDLSHPAEGQEMMESLAVSDDELRRALADVASANRWLGGHAISVAGCGDLVRVAARDGRAPVTILDVGAGGGDVALALAAWARRHHVDVRVIAMDVSPVACRAAREACANEPLIEVVEGDALHRPLAEGSSVADSSIDVVHAGLFLHHVPRPEQPAMLRRLAAIGRIGMIVSDLHRSRAAWLGAWLFARLARTGPLFRHDAPLSVARGFTRAEAEALAGASALRGLSVRHHGLGRITWTLGPAAVR